MTLQSLARGSSNRTLTRSPSSTKCAPWVARLNVGVLFADLAAATEDVRAVSGRKAKVERLALALRGLAPEERRAGAGYLAGAPRQRVLGVGWASLREPVPPAASATLTVGRGRCGARSAGGLVRRGLGGGAAGGAGGADGAGDGLRAGVS